MSKVTDYDPMLPNSTLVLCSSSGLQTSDAHTFMRVMGIRNSHNLLTHKKLIKKHSDSELFQTRFLIEEHTNRILRCKDTKYYQKAPETPTNIDWDRKINRKGFSRT